MLAIALPFGGSGCMQSAVIEARVQAAAETESSLDTLHDYEIGQAAAHHRVAELEGLYRESRGDSRVLVLLARAWCRLTFAFTLDAHEQAGEAGDVALSAYHLERARAGYARASFYADRFLESEWDGYSRALASPEQLGEGLNRNLKSVWVAEGLLWAGFARVGYAGAAPNAPRADAERAAGVLLLRRSLAIAPALAFGTAHLALALNAARATPPDWTNGALELERADAANGGARLFVGVIRARHFACAARDRALFERVIHEVLSASDRTPELRLENAAAKRRARRYLTSARLSAECFP